MPQSHCHILAHIIFSTKDRRPFLNADVAPRLHAYLASVVRDLGCECYRSGGVEDHVHLAIRIKSTIDVAQLIEKIKSNSSRWIKGLSPHLGTFAWQRGYGAFSVSPQFRPEVLAYIDNQREHHKHVSFQDEFRKFLNQYEIAYDERYVWD